ncbi:UPF0496 protein 4 [Bienertia sinuspersici]
MRTTSFFRTLSSRLPSARRSTNPSVAPLPIQSSFSEEITTKLDMLISSEHQYASSNWLVDVLDVAIDAQEATREYVINYANDLALSNLDKEVIDTYLEDNVEMLDACNGLVEKIDMVNEYTNSLQSVSRLFGMNVSSQEMFKECGKLEEKCATLDKCSPKLCKLVGRKETIVVNHEQQDQELHEVLSGSREVASMSCHLLQRAFSFKSRQGLLKSKSKLPTTWASSLNQLQVTLNEEAEKQKKCAPWMMNELEKMVMTARILQDQVKSNKGNVDIDNLKKSCKALEEGVKPLEERVKELYRHLISIRMALLGILSRN